MSGAATRQKDARSSSDASKRAGSKCGDGLEARSELLDLALIETIHRDHDVVGHAAGVDYGKWVKETADSIEREYTEKH
jgi:hypothetical protein